MNISATLNLRKLLLSILTMATLGASAQNIFYVDIDATGNNDGSSWANAFTDLRDACINSITGTEIWVADGTYKRTGTDRNLTFGWDKDSVKVYGGFNGTETMLSQRDWATNKTIVSGDLGNSNTPFDNCYSTFVGPQGTLTNIINYALIDGLIIKDGFAELNSVANSTKHGGGFYSGEYVKNTNLKNCTFTNNYAQRGGAVSIWTYFVDKTVTFESCIFETNTANVASAINARSNSGHSLELNITNCLFNDNSHSIASTSTVPISLFYFQSTAGENIDVNILNSTISKNSINYIGIHPTSLMLLFKGLGSGSQNVTIDNCIIWANDSTDNLIKVHPSSSGFFTSVAINNSISDLTSTATYYSPTNINNLDPLFTDTLNNDFTLTSASPAIDIGSLTGFTLPALDLAGNPRVHNSVIDLGCYEYQGSVGINETTNNLTLTTYPNPTTGKVTFSAIEQISNIEIYNLTGQKVATFNNTNTIDISSLPSGVYTAKVTSNQQVGVSKLIKE